MTYTDIVRAEATHLFAFDEVPPTIFQSFGPQQGGAVLRNYYAGQGPPLTGRVGASLAVAGNAAGGGVQQAYVSQTESPPEVAGAGLWAVEAVVTIDPANPLNVTQGIFHRVNEGTLIGGFWMYLLAGGLLQGGHRNASNGFAFAAATGGLQRGVPYHLMTAYDGTRILVYANGYVVGASATGKAPDDPSDGPLRIGGTSGVGSGFIGLIDDVAVHIGSIPDPVDRTALLGFKRAGSKMLHRRRLT